jgi:hypothetical protein
MRDPILRYFEDVKRAFEGSGIAVGVYSNGCICNAIRERGLAQYFWLSGSTGHSGTQAFYNSGAWTLFQNALDITPQAAGFGVDTNLASPSTNGYFGQWTDRGAQAAAHTAADTTKAFAERRFVVADTDVKDRPDAASATRAIVRKNQNIRLQNDSRWPVPDTGWTEIVTQETGAKPGSQWVQGWVPSSRLAPMKRFPDNSSNYGLCGSGVIPSDTGKYQNCERATSRIR